MKKILQVAIILYAIDAQAQNTGIGTNTPAARLDIIGNIKITDGTQGAGKLLTSDANGFARWTADANWRLTGNGGTNDNFNFIGTTDSVALNFRVNNKLAGRISVDPNQGSTFWGYKAGLNNDGSNLVAIKNTFLGYEAGASNLQGSCNVATGFQSLFSNISGNNNVATGFQSLFSNLAGHNNVANGHQALYANTNGEGNTANGYQALKSNATGNYNTATGYRSLYGNSIGLGNTASGSFSMYSNTSGNYNTALGFNSLYDNISGSSNVAIGTDALKSNTVGNNNIAIGNQALFSNTGSSYLLAIGDSSLANTVNSSGNTAIGVNSMNRTTTGSFNTAAGYSSLYSNTSGGQNSAFGYYALYGNINGSANTANGFQSLSNNTSGSNNAAYGYWALSSNISGNGNTAMGDMALNSNNTGSNNTALGKDADVSSVNLTNATAIGANALVTASNSLVLGSIAGINGATSGTNVGIGTISPAYDLHIEGNGSATDVLRVSNDVNTTYDSTLVFTASGRLGIGTASPVNKLTTNGNADFTGRVGIGNTAPAYPLTVSSTVSGQAPLNTNAPESWFNPGTTLQQSTSGTTPGAVSIFAQGYVASATGFVAHSDARLKNIIGQSNSAADLQTLNRIEITDYTMRNTAADAASYKKVIAQQLQQVYPQAVKTTGGPEYIANIYQLAERFILRGNDLIIYLSMPIAAIDSKDIVPGAAVKCYFNNKNNNDRAMKELEGELKEIAGNKLTVQLQSIPVISSYDKLFVFGTRVKDLLSVDYEAISMLNVSATQEISKQIAAANKQIGILEKQKTETDSRLKNIEIKLDDLLKASAPKYQ